MKSVNNEEDIDIDIHKINQKQNQSVLNIMDRKLAEWLFINGCPLIKVDTEIKKMRMEGLKLFFIPELTFVFEDTEAVRNKIKQYNKNTN